MILESDRLILKRLSPQDVNKKYVEWLNNPEINWSLESRFKTHNLEEIQDYVKEINSTPLNYLFGIYLKNNSENKYIGNIKLGPINTHHSRSSIGLFIGDTSCWGKGLATESIRRISQFAFEKLNLIKLHAGCYESNMGSKKAFINSGFIQEGLLKNHINLDNTRDNCLLFGLENINYK
jgi:RimJ/RimL family protein N-acetyltransferase